MIDEVLLKILACPNCDSRPPLESVGESLRCTECGKTYPVVDGIPDLLPESAVDPGSQDA